MKRLIGLITVLALLVTPVMILSEENPKNLDLLDDEFLKRLSKDLAEISLLLQELGDLYQQMSPEEQEKFQKDLRKQIEKFNKENPNTPIEIK